MSRAALLIASISLITACEQSGPPTSEPAESDHIVLVAGATGRQGGAVARELLARGYRVRALTRNPDQDAARELLALGAEVLQGNFDNRDSLDAAMEGAYGAFLVTVTRNGVEAEVRQGKTFADAAHAAGIRHFVFTSVANADRGTGVPHFDSKYEIETHIRDLGLPYSVVRPVTFMDNWEGTGEQTIDNGYRDPRKADHLHHFIAVQDIGRIVAEAFDNPNHWIGRALDISGQTITLEEVVGTMSQVADSDIEYVQISWDTYAEKMPPEIVKMTRWFEAEGYDVDVAAVRDEFPGMLTVEQYLQQSGWGEPPADVDVMNGAVAFSHVTVGVANLDTALGLWVDTFSFEVVEERQGADAALASLWGLAPDEIARQAFIRTPGASVGALHLVEFARPDPPVRENAAVFDRVPKNLDVYARDLPNRYEELKQAGFEFRSEWVEMAGPGDVRFREVHMSGHDAINVVLLEILDGVDYPYSPTGYAGVGPLIIVVPDAAAEQAFYRDVVGLDPLVQDVLAGPEIEKMVGLPPGAGLDFRVLGRADEPLGRIEVVEYQETAGVDLIARARPPALGTLHVTYRVVDLTALLDRLKASDVAFTEHGEVETIYGQGPVISFTTPAGFRIEVQEQS